MQFETAYGTADDQSASYFCGLEEGLAIGAITGGVNSGASGGGTGYTLGKGGIYLTTAGDITISDGTHTENCVDLDGNASYSSEILKLQSFLNGVGFYGVGSNGDYVTATFFDSYSIKIGPFYARGNGTLDTSNSWKFEIIAGSEIVKSFSSIVSKVDNDVWRFAIKTVTLDIVGYMQKAWYFPRGNVYFYQLGDTDYCYINGIIYKGGLPIQNRITCNTPGWTNAFNSSYLKLFCNPSTYTEFEQQMTECYPVLVDGIADESLIVARFRAPVSDNAWIIAREVTQRVGYLMCTHITFGSNTAAFLILDYGEQYADYVDNYLSQTSSAEITSYIATEGGE